MVKKMKTNDPAHEIGDEILEEIVLCLPVKFVIRFSCVSKSWNSIISSSRFIKIYRARALAREKVMVVPFNPMKKKKCGSLFRVPLLQKDVCEIKKGNTSLLVVVTSLSSIDKAVCRYSDKIVIPFPKGEKKKVCYIAQCEGLVCATVGSNLHLWNPSIRSVKKLAPSPSKLKTRRRQFVFGLGYDSVGDDYKLLLIPIGITNKESELYSLKTNSWRKIPSFHKSRQVKKQMCAFVNGALHWVDSSRIVSFELSSEKYVELVAPKYDSDSTSDVVEVSVLKGKLCFTHKCGDVKFVVWLMEDYRIGTSWMKMLQIDHSNVKPYNPRWYMRPIYLYDSGNIMAIVHETRNAANQVMLSEAHTTGLYVYKKHEATLKKIILNIGKTSVQYVFVYVESLVHL